MDKGGSQPISYKTHILIGISSDGAMSVVCDWPHLPALAEVQQAMQATRESYVTFALCTPTSILPADGDSGGTRRGRSALFGSRL
jgi:hypothetical protein